MGYDNQVKVVKILCKFNGDLNKTIEHIQFKSKRKADKFKMAGLKL